RRCSWGTDNHFGADGVGVLTALNVARTIVLNFEERTLVKEWTTPARSSALV
ncbi:hypothetical protein ZWY2020_028321, partial [Hordeum vulgare]